MYWCTLCCAKLFSHVQLFAIPRTVAHQASLSIGIGVGCHDLFQRILPKQGSNPGLSHCRQFLTIWATREAHIYAHIALIIHHSVYDTMTVYSWKETPLATKKESFLKQEKLMTIKKELATNNDTKKWEPFHEEKV